MLITPVGSMLSGLHKNLTCLKSCRAARRACRGLLPSSVLITPFGGMLNGLPGAPAYLVHFGGWSCEAFNYASDANDFSGVEDLQKVLILAQRRRRELRPPPRRGDRRQRTGASRWGASVELLLRASIESLTVANAQQSAAMLSLQLPLQQMLYATQGCCIGAVYPYCFPLSAPRTTILQQLIIAAICWRPQALY